VNELADVLADPQVQARELLHQMSWAYEPTPVPVVNPAVRLSETPGEVRNLPPQLGEHTDAILAELGYSANEIADFRQQAVI
jgi:formyl-CoA transferase/CoA:oxalate CoA-transferase